MWHAVLRSLCALLVAGAVACRPTSGDIGASTEQALEGGCSGPYGQAAACSGDEQVRDLCFGLLGGPLRVQKTVAQTFRVEAPGEANYARLVLTRLSPIAPNDDTLIDVEIRPVIGGSVSLDPETAVAGGSFVARTLPHRARHEVVVPLAQTGIALEPGTDEEPREYAVVVSLPAASAQVLSIGVACHERPQNGWLAAPRTRRRLPSGDFAETPFVPTARTLAFAVWTGEPDPCWSTEAGCVAQDETPPTWPPGNRLQLSALSSESLTLTWTAAIDNVGVTAYRVLRDGELLAQVAPSPRSFTVSGTMPGAVSFAVEAGDEAGNWSTGGPTLTVRPGSLVAEGGVEPGQLSQSASFRLAGQISPTSQTQVSGSESYRLELTPAMAVTAP